jgi:YVTN family beta-propeller protein
MACLWSTCAHIPTWPDLWDNVGQRELAVIDGGGNYVVHTINVGVNPNGVVVNRSIDRIYVANSGAFSPS